MTNVNALETLMRLTIVTVYAKKSIKNGYNPSPDDFCLMCDTVMKSCDLVIEYMSQTDNIQPWELKERADAIMEEYDKALRS